MAARTPYHGIPSHYQSPCNFMTFVAGPIGLRTLALLCTSFTEFAAEKIY